MVSASPANAKTANWVPAQSRGSSRTNVRFTDAVMQKAQDLFKTKVAAEVAAYAKCGMRTAEHWKAGERQMDVEDFLNLLTCEQGVAFLDVFFEFVPPLVRDRWLKMQLLNQRLEKAERKLAADAREADQLRFQLNNR